MLVCDSGAFFVIHCLLLQSIDACHILPAQLGFGPPKTAHSRKPLEVHEDTSLSSYMLRVGVQKELVQRQLYRALRVSLLQCIVLCHSKRRGAYQLAA